MKKVKSGRKKSIVLLSIISVLIILGALMSFIPAQFGIKDYVPVTENISLGIDLKGGVYIVYKADKTDKDGNVLEERVFNDTLNGTITVLQNRLGSKGFTEATVVRQNTSTDSLIRIEIPDVKDPEQVFEIIGKPAVLEFRDENGTVLLEGSKHLEAAYATYDTNQNSANYNKPAVGLKFNAEGTVKFADATRKIATESGYQRRIIAIYVDNKEISSPSVSEEISGGSAIISPMASFEEAENLAIQLQSGALPLNLTEYEKGTISPTLGQDALKGGIIAGIIGLALVMVFMCIYYKGFGLVSSISLIIYSLLLLYVLAGMPVAFSLPILPTAQMTLPGIAGIILSIGMAIDANIIIFERVKDEYKLGKSLESSIKIGYRRAFAAILDSNITTLLAGVVLLIFGQGTIKGFAHVLIVGIVLSVICALVFSRYIMKIFLGITSSAKFYGAKREDEYSFESKAFKKDFKIVENKKKFFIVSLSIIMAGLLVTVIFGLNRGIDFTGGNIITASIGSELEQDGNFVKFADTINGEIDKYASENNLAIDKSAAQMAGSSANKGITIRYNIKNIKDDAVLSEHNNRLNEIIDGKLQEKLTELNISDINYKYDIATVGSSLSGQLVSSAFYSVLLSALLMLIYLAFRFEILMGVASVLALLHDVLIMVAFVAIFRYQINSSFIAAMITIIGYSINATIVIFDRVRENTKRLSMREASYAEIANKSVKETIMRSINTSITTIITILILFIVGVPSIKEFAFPIMIGLLAGTYSSVFLSVSMWVMLKNFADKHKLLKSKKDKKETSAAVNAKTAKAR